MRFRGGIRAVDPTCETRDAQAGNDSATVSTIDGRLAPRMNLHLLSSLPYFYLLVMQIARNFPFSLCLFLVVNYVSFTSAAPGQWFTRRACEFGFCPSDWDIAPLIGDTVGAVGSAASSFLDWLLPDDSDVVDGKLTTGTPTQFEPDIDIQVLAPPSKECNVVVPGGESQNVSPSLHHR